VGFGPDFGFGFVVGFRYDFEFGLIDLDFYFDLCVD